MYMFVMLGILAFQGQLKVVEPLSHLDNLTAEQCIALLKEAEKRFDLKDYEFRCIKIGHTV